MRNARFIRKYTFYQTYYYYYFDDAHDDGDDDDDDDNVDGDDCHIIDRE